MVRNPAFHVGGLGSIPGLGRSCFGLSCDGGGCCVFKKDGDYEDGGDDSDGNSVVYTAKNNRDDSTTIIKKARDGLETNINEDRYTSR